MKKRRISEQRFEAKLAKLLERWLERSGGSVTTFRESGVLTNNHGLVVSLPDRTEFQITIVESTRGY